MSVKWIVPWYEMLAFEIMLGIAVACSIVNACAQLQIKGLLRDLVEALQEAEG